MATSKFWCWGVPFVAFATACAGGQTGDEGPNVGGKCEPVSELPLGLEEIGPGGYAASDVFGFVLGTHRARLAWNEPQIGPQPIAPPAEPDESIEVRVALASEGARWVESALVTGSDRRCPDYTEVDVTVDLISSRGAFDEHLEGKLRIESYGHAIFQEFRPYEELSGSATRGARDPGELQISMIFSAYGTEGSMNAWPSARDVGEVASFRTELDTSVEPAPVRLAEIAGSASPLHMTFVDGTADDVRFGFEADAASAELWRADVGEAGEMLSAPGLVVAATLELSGETRSFERRLGVRLGAVLGRDGSLGPVGFQVDYLCRGGPPDGFPKVADFVAHCGDWGVDLTGFDAAFLDFTETSFTQGAGSGNLSVVGVTYGDFVDLSVVGQLHFERAPP